MFNVYLPEGIYRRLPAIYALLAIVLAAVLSSPLKWVTITALLLASALTVRRRRAHRRRAPVLPGRSAGRTAA